MGNDEGECLTPKKSRFATLDAARNAIRHAQLTLNKTLHPYDTCPCGWIHLTSKQRKAADPVIVVVEGEELDAGEELQLFAQITRLDVVGKASPQDAAWLRRRENLVKWSDSLKVFQVDIGSQLQARAGDQSEKARAWRKRLGEVQVQLRMRRAEVKQLLIEKHTSRYARKGGEAPEVSEEFKKYASEKDLRRIAGERAIDRLIGAHRDEFTTYLSQEYRQLGLELIPRIEKHLPGTREDKKGEDI